MNSVRGILNFFAYSIAGDVEEEPGWPVVCRCYVKVLPAVYLDGKQQTNQLFWGF